MNYIQSSLFKRFDNLIFGFSTKIHAGSEAPFYFNLSYTVGDNPDTVAANRKLFAESLGLTFDSVAVQKQVHSDIITYVDKGGKYGESDAFITDVPMIGLAISSADCVPVFIYDPIKKIIAGIHSGWKGTELQIVRKTVIKLKEEFSVNPSDLYVYIGPSVSQNNYEVGAEFCKKFDSKYILEVKDKFYLGVAEVNYDILIEEGVKSDKIQKSNLCSFERDSLLHSYRRDGLKSGRAHGIIAMKGLK